MLSYKNEPLQYTDYSFSPEGFLEQRKIYSAPEKMTDLFVFKNNDKGERISEHHENFVNGDIIDEELKYEYDKKGNWVLRVHYRDNIPYRLFERDIKYYD
jgi:hypothetical protein